MYISEEIFITHNNTNLLGDGYIDMKELKVVALLLGTMLTKDELDEFMKEADSVSRIFSFIHNRRILVG